MDPLEVRRNRPANSNVKEPVRETASQTAGPYVHIGCMPNWVGINRTYTEDLLSNTKIDRNDAVAITGRVFEGDGIVAKDVLLEFWQPDETGQFENGVWRRAATDLETGEYRIETVVPGSINDLAGTELVPFIVVWVAARGINIGLQTRIYFPEYADRQENDPHLKLVRQDRLTTLFAKPGKTSKSYIFDIHLQGDSETVFFET